MPGYVYSGLLTPLWWLAGTLLVGFVAGLITQRNLGIAQAFLVGFLGSLLGGLLIWFLRPYLHLAPGDSRTGYLLVSLAAGLLGAVLVLLVTGLGAGTPVYRDPPRTQTYLPRYERDPLYSAGQIDVAAAPQAASRSSALLLLGALLLVVGLALGALAVIQA